MTWFQDGTYTLEAASVTGGLISLVIKVVLFWGLIRLVHSFGQGLRERSEYILSDVTAFSLIGFSPSNITLSRRQNKRYIGRILTNLCRFLNILNYFPLMFVLITSLYVFFCSVCTQQVIKHPVGVDQGQSCMLRAYGVNIYIQHQLHQSVSLTFLLIFS